MIARFVLWCRGYPRSVVALVFLVVGVCASGTGKLVQVVSIVDQLDPGMESTRQIRRAQELFGRDTSLAFVVSPATAQLRAGDACRLTSLLRELARKHPEVTQVITPFDLRRQRVSGDDLIHYPRLLSEPCELAPEASIDLTALAATPWRAALLGPAGKEFSVVVRLGLLDEPGPYGSFRPELVRRLMEEIRAGSPYPLEFTGTAAQEYYTMQGLAEAQWLNGLALVLILVLFRIFLGTFRAAGLYFLTLLPSSAIVYGLMGHLGHPVDPLSVCLFLMLAVSSLEDFIFLARESGGAREKLDAALVRLALPCALTSLTTVLAFSTLCFSELESIRRFGLWAAVGGVLEWVMTFAFLPALLRLLPAGLRWYRPERSFGTALLESGISKTPPRWVSRAALLAFALALVSILNFRLGQTPSEMFPKDHPFQIALDAILRDRGWVAEIGVVYERTAGPELKQQVRAFLAAHELVHSTESWPGVVDFVAGPGAPVSNHQLAARELGITAFGRRYRAVGGEERDLLLLKTTNTEKLNRFRRQLGELCPQRECWATGEFVGFADFSEALIGTLFKSLFGSILLVAAVIVLVARQRRKLALCAGLLASSLWGPAVMLALIYLCDISINFVTCVVASTLIGLTGDNAIMFLLADDDLAVGVRERAVGSIQTALVMSVCSLTFVFSYFEPPRMLGILLAVGFLASLLGDVWLLKGLTRKKEDA